MRGGRRLTGPEPLQAAQRRCAADLAWLPPEAKGLRAALAVPVTVSPPLTALQERLTRELAGP
jgi:nicotinate phosphoribosyltransferase